MHKHECIWIFIARSKVISHQFYWFYTQQLILQLFIIYRPQMLIIINGSKTCWPIIVVFIYFTNIKTLYFLELDSNYLYGVAALYFYLYALPTEWMIENLKWLVTWTSKRIHTFLCFRDWLGYLIANLKNGIKIFMVWKYLV